MLSRYKLVALAACLMVSPAVADPKDYLDKADAWFAEDQAKRVAANILSFQSDLGGWPKNENTTEKPYEGDRRSLEPT